jgi:hypothetical protein
LKINAAMAGWNLSYLVINYQNKLIPGLYARRHALNGAFLSDGTFVYIEPQTDKIYSTPDEVLKDISPLSRLSEFEEIRIIHISIIW